MKSKRIRELARIALLVALLAVLSQIAIPLPSLFPITLHIYAVSLIGYYLRAKKSIIVILVYLALGAIGIPIFASFQGGFAYLLGYTGGFIFGFIPLCLLCSLGRELRHSWIFGIVGVLLCHLMGILQYSFIARLDFLSSLLTVSLPFLLKDIVLTILAFITTKSLNKIIKKS